MKHSLETRRKLSKLIKHRWKYHREFMMEGHRKSAKSQKGIFPKQFRLYRKLHPEFYANLPKKPSTRKKISLAIKQLWSNPQWRRKWILSRRKPRVLSKGYWLIHVDGHPYADDKERVEEHRYKMEQKIGRLLKLNEVVHHINGVKNDNRLSNLQLMSRGEHIGYHNRYRHKHQV